MSAAKQTSKDNVNHDAKVNSEQKKEELKKDVESKLDQAKAQGKKAADEISKEANKIAKELDADEKQIIQHVQEYLQCASSKIQSVFSSLTSKTIELTQTSQKELENPVVVAQVVAGAGALAAAYGCFLERHRIRTDNPIVVGIHSAIITGLIGLDVYLFNSYYPKYKKN